VCCGLRTDNERRQIRRVRMSLLPCIAVAIATRGLYGQDTAAVAIANSVTIGSRVGDRTSTKSLVPIDVVTSKAIEASGLVETWQILQRLIPTANSAHRPRQDDGTRPVTLRGLSPGHVLILVNGKRLHNPAPILGGAVMNGTPGNDVGSIPSIAIERIEILRDGAAAQYGSDAIAGVINIVLKANSGGEARSSFGRVSSSEGGRNFHDGGVVDAEAAYGVTIKTTGNFMLSAELMRRGPTNRAYPDQRQQYFTGDPRNSNPPVVRNQEGDGESNAAGLLLNVTAPVGDKSEAYFVGDVMHRRAVAPSLFSRSSDETTVRAIYPDGFLPRNGQDIDDFSLSAGMRAEAHRWRLDASTTLGGNRFRYDLHDSDNASMGVASPTSFYLGEERAYQWTSNLDAVRSLTVSRRMPLTIAAGGEFRIDTYAIGAGDSASYEDGGVPILDGPFAGQPADIGAQAGPGFQPIDEVSVKRSNVAGYLDIDSRVTNRLEVDGAVRAERYSDFGGTFDGKIAARFELFRGVALRASQGTGFRAPTLNQSFFASTSSAFTTRNGVGAVYQTRLLPVHTEEARLLGATPLEPEKSVNRSAGLVIDIPTFPTVTVDYYQIRIDGRIVPTFEFTDTSVTRLLAEHGHSGIAGAQYFANAANTKTQGIDVVSRYGMVVGGEGVLQLVAGYNQNRTRITEVKSTPPELTQLQSTLFGRTQRGSIEVAQPDQTFALTTDYSFRRFSLDIHNQRFGRTRLLDAFDPAKDQSVEPTWLTDVGFSYAIARRLTASASVANVFDRYPSEWNGFKNGLNARDLSLQANFRYAVAISPFAANGRTVYLRFTYR
jgi:iron complex outermembrane receptor protein